MAGEKAAKYRQEIQQMMFVSGETAEPSAETTGLIEEIVRQQVIEMLTRSTELANRRGSRSIAVSDLIFLIRHDKAKVSRLKNFLSWKDVRKNVKDSDDKGGGDADVGDFDEGAAIPEPANNPASKKTNASTTKKAKLILPWEVHSFFTETPPDRIPTSTNTDPNTTNLPSNDLEDEPDDSEEEQNEATLARLASADERTRNMTRDEYVFWSDCRQASFTFRKGKRFREWAGFGVVTDSKPNDDIVDILGFLTFEIVQTITEEAIRVKESQERGEKGAGADAASGSSTAAGGGAGGAGNDKKRKRPGSSGSANGTTTDTGAATADTEAGGTSDPNSAAAQGVAGGGLFEMQEEGRTPVEAKHVREAFRRLQVVPNRYRFMRQGYAGMRTTIRLV